MRTTTFATLLLAASSVIDARLPDIGRRDAIKHRRSKDDLKSKVMALISKVMHPRSLAPRQDQCVEDEIYDILAPLPAATITPFCQRVVQPTPVTQFVEITPTSVVRVTTTTRTRTETDPVVETPFSTITVLTTTTGAIEKRDASPAAVPDRQGRDPAIVKLDTRDLQDRAIMHKIRQATPSTNDTDINAAISSFCVNCVDNIAPTTTVTYTVQATTVTIGVQAIATASIATTIVAAPQLTTVTNVVTVRPGIAPPTTTFDGTVPTPTADIIECPADNGEDQTQIVNGRNYIYGIDCGQDLVDEDLAERTYDTFSECISACSIANDGLSGAACLGVSFDQTITDGSPNCFLKRSAYLLGPNSARSVAILRVVGVPAPINTDVLTANRNAFASSTSADGVDGVLPAGTGLPLVTPAPTANRVEGSDPSSFSSHTESSMSFYSSGNGSWTASFYSTHSDTFAAPTPAVTSTSTSFNETVRGASGAGSLDGSNGGTSGGALGNSTGTLRNQTVVVNDGNFTEVTSTLTYLYPNGTVVTQVITTTYGNRTAGTADSDNGAGGAGGAAGGGSLGGAANGVSGSEQSSSSETNSTTTTSETTSIVVIIHQTSTSSSSSNSNSGGSVGGSAGGGSGASTTTLFDTTTIQVSTPTGGSNAGGDSGGAGGSVTSGASSTIINSMNVTTTPMPTPFPILNSTSGAYPPFTMPNATTSSSNSVDNRGGSQTTSPSLSTSSPLPYNGTTSSTGFPSPTSLLPPFPSNGTHSRSHGTGVPSGTVPSAYPPYTPSFPYGNRPPGTAPTTSSTTWVPYPSGNSTTLTGPTGTSPPTTSFVPINTTTTMPPTNSTISVPTNSTSSSTSFTGLPRSGTASTTVPISVNITSSLTPTAPTTRANITTSFAMTGTGSRSTSLITQSTCATVTVGTVTVTETTTVATCASTCAPGGYGYSPYRGGGPPAAYWAQHDIN